MAQERSPQVGGAFAAAAAPALGRAPRTHARAALGQVADLLGRSPSGARSARGGSRAPVVHVGARTGVLTGQLLRAGVPLLATERHADALAHLRRALPDTAVVAADDAALPFAGRSVRAVLVSELGALRRPEVVGEVGRVLVGGSPLVLVADRSGGSAGEWPVLAGWGSPDATLHEESQRMGGPVLATEVVVWRSDR